MSHIDVCLCLCVRYQWLIMVLMLGISSGYWLRHKPNPRGDDFLAPTANQLVYGDLFTYTRARMRLCARMHVCEFDNTHTKVHNVSKFNDGGLECLSPCSPQLISNAACLLISPQHRGSDATSVCTANCQHGLPKLPTHHTGTFTPHERWEKDSSGFTLGTHNEDVVWVVQILNYLVVCLLVSMIMLHAHPLFLYEFYTFRCDIIYLSHPHVTYYVIVYFITFLYNAGRITWC